MGYRPDESIRSLSCCIILPTKKGNSMGKQLRIALLATIVSAVVGIGMKFLEIHMDRDRGKVTVGAPVTIGGSVFTELEVANWSSSTLDGLVLIVPESVSVDSIASSFPISIDELKGDTGSQVRKRLTLSGIPPLRITRIMVPLSSPKDLQDISLPNVRQLKYSSERSDRAYDPWSPTFRELMLTPLVSALLYGLIFYYWDGVVESRIQKLRSELSEIREEAKKFSLKADQQLAQQDERVAELRAYSMK